VKGRRARLAAEDGDDHAPVGAGLDVGEVVVALGVAGVDGEVADRIAGLDELAEGGEGLAGERLDGEREGGCGAHGGASVKGVGVRVVAGAG
jgi:hypothetical protein